MRVGRKLSIFSWSMYDFASTIFSMNVISLYFALWVTVDMKEQDIFYSIAISLSMLLAAFTSPILGAISDHFRRRMPFLITTISICALFTTFISLTTHILPGLIFFIIANYCFQVAEVFYNALLPTVSGNRQIGRVSGIGIGLGYCGTIVGLLLVSPFAEKWGRHATFIPTALFYFIFSLPCFIFVKDKRQTGGNRDVLGIKQHVKNAFLKTKNTIIDIRRYKGLLPFFVAAFISFNAISTVFVFMSVYTEKVMHFSNTEIVTFYIVSSAFAAIGSFFSGFLTDYLGAKYTFTGALSLWCVAVFIAAISMHKYLFWIVGPMVGISLGTTWTSARTLAINLSPPDMVGEIFGFYGLMGRTSAVIGPLLWGVVVWGFQSLGLIKYRLAVISLLLFLSVGLLILQKVPCQKKRNP